MGLRTWIYEKTGIKLKKFEAPQLKKITSLEGKNKSLEEKIAHLESSLTVLKKELSSIDSSYTSPTATVDKSAKIGNRASVSSHCTVGKHTNINYHASVWSHTSIGNYCSIARFANIAPDHHPTDWLSTHTFQYNDNKNQSYSKKRQSTTIGHDVWIGANAVIMTGVTIGHGAIIGAGAIVTKDVPPYAIVGGVPAKIIRYRFDDETIQELLQLKWWDLDAKILMQNEINFSNTAEAIKQLKALDAHDNKENA